MNNREISEEKKKKKFIRNIVLHTSVSLETFNVWGGGGGRENISLLYNSNESIEYWTLNNHENIINEEKQNGNKICSNIIYIIIYTSNLIISENKLYARNLKTIIAPLT